MAMVSGLPSGAATAPKQKNPNKKYRRVRLRNAELMMPMRARAIMMIGVWKINANARNTSMMKLSVDSMPNVAVAT